MGIIEVILQFFGFLSKLSDSVNETINKLVIPSAERCQLRRRLEKAFKHLERFPSTSPEELVGLYFDDLSKERQKDASDILEVELKTNK